MADVKNLRVAVYARYSTDKQREVSIDDQLSRCRETAKNNGLVVDERLIFTDSAVTAAKKQSAFNRRGYNMMMEAWDNDQIDIVISDELSRLVRHPRQVLELRERIEETGVRLITADGLDTERQNWQLNFALQGMVGDQSIRDTQHRVGRSTRGALDRGYMIATPPYGYIGRRLYDDAGDKKGTEWYIDEAEADIVREMFDYRRKGLSFVAIAKRLNDRGIQTPRISKKTGKGYWRPGTIFRMLANPIYKGIFVFHGSPTFRKKMSRRRNKEMPKEYMRPHLRIVDDEIWEYCNKKKISRTGYGGGKHILSGLVRCGVCNSILTVAVGGSAPALYCAQCAQARRVGVSNVRPANLSVNGLQEVMNYAMGSIFSEPVVTEFRKQLTKRLTQGVDEELFKAKIERDRLLRECERMAKALRKFDDDDQVLIREYESTKEEYVVLNSKVKGLENRVAVVDRDAINKQLKVDPKTVFPKLWRSSMPVERIRALLSSLFEEIVLEGKPERFVAIIKITVSPGVVAAILSETVPVDMQALTMRFKLRGGPRRPSVWEVELLQDEEAEFLIAKWA